VWVPEGEHYVLEVIEDNPLTPYANSPLSMQACIVFKKKSI
jgi:hypothetical protein